MKRTKLQDKPLEPPYQPWGIDKVKTHKGHEGEPCAQGMLVYRVGAPRDVAHFGEDEWGGSMRFDIKDKALWAEFQRFCTETRMSFKGEDGKDIVLQHEKEDWAVGQMVDHWDLVRLLTRLCKTALVFRSPRDAEGEWQRLPGKALDQGAYRWVKERYPGCTVANEHLVVRDRPAWFPGGGGQRVAT